MAFPPQPRDPFLELPNILSPSPQRCRQHQELLLSGGPAISIPKLESQGGIPQPLPPPSFFASLDRPTRRRVCRRRTRASGNSSSPPSSSMHSLRDNRSTTKRRGTVGSINGDEGQSSYISVGRSQDPLRPMEVFRPFQLPFVSAADLHGYSMKRKLDTVYTLEKSPQPLASSALRNHLDQLNTRAPVSNMPLQMPNHHGSSDVNSAAGIPVDTPIYSSAVSPGSVPFPHFHRQLVEREGSAMDYSPRTRTCRINSDDAPPGHSGHGFTGLGDMAVDRGNPGDSSTEVHGRDLISQASPTPPFYAVPQTSSTSPMSSAAISRSNSYNSIMSITPSSAVTMTTATSYDRRPSGANSSRGVSATCSNSPYTTPTSIMHHSPRNSMSGTSNLPGRKMSSTSPRKMADVQKPAAPKVEPLLMCSCCPKKPKKFNTAEQLAAHEAEKQYACIFCGNRFKNKNEAERHQNSLHVRSHSWACTTLTSYDGAFHDSISRPGEADACGYCGRNFPRSGRGPGSGALSGSLVPNHATEQDWDERIRHLREVHRFQECNLAKKFFRADHFRQHLKHSHCGSSGKWTNVLEHACMTEEEPSATMPAET
ncbi:hypothetical protein E4U55_005247 [Claviceps digitariae]|nr:hypothetical protein E4U55_005247 [Claviceps digitariae]